MATIWEHQVFVIGSAASIGGAIQALDIAFPRDDGQPRDPSKPDEVGCKLSATGELPATHYGAAFAVTEQLRETLEGMGLASVPGIYYWRCTNPGGVLSTTNHPASFASIGQPWDWSNCKAALGLNQK